MEDLRKKALLIDLDGTLINTLPDRITAVQFALKSLGLPKILDENVRYYIGDGVFNLSQRALLESLRDNPQLIDGKLIQALANCYESYYLEHICEDTVLYPTAKETLLQLREQGIPMGLITNKKNVLTHSLIQSLGIADLFNVVMAGEDGAHKPAPDLLNKAVERLGVSVSDVLMVGDSLDDYHASQSAQITMVGVSYGYRPLSNNDVPYLINAIEEILSIFIE